MLTHLYIKGLAIIEELSIELSPRLNVITGETGAGKSILIKALNLVLGGKAHPDIIRNGWDKASISAVFELQKNHVFYSMAESAGIDVSDKSGNLIIRRQVAKKGRSQAWINDQPVTQGLLRELGVLLIDIFGQHDNHLLLDPQNHCSYVDQFLDSALINDYKSLFKKVSDDIRDLRTLIKEFQQKIRDKDYFEFRLKELDEFDPSVAEFESLTEMLDRSKLEIKQRQIFSQVETIVDHSYKNGTMSKAFMDVYQLLEKVDPSEAVDELMNAADEISTKIDDFSFQVGKCQAAITMDDSKILFSQTRIGKYKELFKKLNVVNPAQLIVMKNQIAEDLAFIDEAKIQVIHLINKISKDSKKLYENGLKLRDNRKKTFEKIALQIKRELQQLNMKGAELCLEMEPLVQTLPEFGGDFMNEYSEEIGSILEIICQCGQDGLDRVQFLLRSNLGEDAKPLAKIASGGEVARIMLGIKKVLSADAQTCVMVFDEIDTGISGQTASIVGQKLAEISKKFQVICISHLPQVAVYGDTHFKVSKKTEDGRTESKIKKLTAESSLEEVARLLSGGKITKSSLENARSLQREINIS